MRELVIDRKTWYRGKGSELSRLLRSQDRTMCCLGFFSRDCGYSEAKLLDVAFPSDLAQGRVAFDFEAEDLVLPKDMEWLLDFPAGSVLSVEEVIGAINDDPIISDAGREEKLTAIFADYNINVMFIN